MLLGLLIIPAILSLLPDSKLKKADELNKKGTIELDAITKDANINAEK
jgi:hypothetical protein